MSPTQLEVHLKNGAKYVENFESQELEEMILEMMGYTVFEIRISCCIWNERSNKLFTFVSTPEELEAFGIKACDEVFSYTPYLKSKYLDGSVSVDNDEIAGTQALEIALIFRGRIDKANEINDEFWERAREIAIYSVTSNDMRCSVNVDSVTIRCLDL